MLEARMIQLTKETEISEDGDWTKERMAALSGVLLYNSLKDPYSLEINKITFGYQDITYGDGVQVQDMETVATVFHAANSLGNSVIGTAEAYVWPKDDNPDYYSYMYDETIPDGKALIINVLNNESDLPDLKKEEKLDTSVIVDKINEMLSLGLYD